MPDDALINASKGFYNASSGLAYRGKIRFWRKITTPSISLKFGSETSNDVLINALKGFYDAFNSLASRAEIVFAKKSTTPSISLKFGTVMPDDPLINTLRGFCDASSTLTYTAKFNPPDRYSKNRQPLRFRSNLAQ